MGKGPYCTLCEYAINEVDVMLKVYHKGTVSPDFRLLFFSWISSPKPLSTLLGPFQIFSQNSRRYSQLKVHHWCCWHRWQMEKIFNLKSFNYFLDLTYRYIFAFKFTLRSQQPDIAPINCLRCRWYRWQIATGVVDTGGFLPQVSLTQVANLPPVSTTLAKLVAKFSANLPPRWCTLTCDYLREFSKNSKRS